MWPPNPGGPSSSTKPMEPMDATTQPASLTLILCVELLNLACTFVIFNPSMARFR
ncbi:hypothetical protein L227DRAFT_70486 [Lentinus tigrinus ALCF2SS1-6]|uniref:Uncharacterized protein n=1 Tax=Lentinus tigrinus ALCF2SS1-6 TaxID=1328759 RepID=A0A5C2SCI4_9APHY|nr:hypothetical protein L227DRAFT_70486 [Lentinus tigrinus ALCF2SS1-6]